MHKILLALVALFGLTFFSTSCIFPSRTRTRTYHRSGQRCRTTCVQYAYRTTYRRRCRIWRNGYCVSYHQYNDRVRYCVRRATRCYN